MKYLGLVFIISWVLACQSQGNSQKEALEASQAKVEELQTAIHQMEAKGKILTHHVYFNLKASLTDEEESHFEKGLRSLSKVEVAKGLKVGRGADTGDSRLVSDYDFVLSMYFEGLEDLEQYAKDSFHLEVRKEIGPMLEKAPVVYDSWVE